VSIEKRDFFIVFRSNISNLVIEICIETNIPHTLIRSAWKPHVGCKFKFSQA